MNFKGELLEDFDANINDFAYKKGQIIEVTEFDSIKHTYAVYKNGYLDWIPKDKIKLIEE